MSEALDEAQVDKTEPDIPMVDTEPVEVKTASQGIVEKAEIGRLGNQLLSKHKEEGYTNSDIKASFAQLPESKTCSITTKRADNGDIRIEIRPKTNAKPLGVAGLEALRDKLDLVFPHITSEQKAAFL